MHLAISFLHSVKIVTESYLMTTLSKYCHDLALGLFVETYHITSFAYDRIDQGWLRRNNTRFGQKESGKMIGCGQKCMEYFFIVPICDEFVSDHEVMLDLYYCSLRKCLRTFMVPR